MSSLIQLSYDAVAKKHGITSRDIVVGEKYKLLDLDGHTFLPLGKCLQNDYEAGTFHNDGVDHVTIEFEKNNDNAAFGTLRRNNKLEYWGNASTKKLNIYPNDEPETGGRKRKTALRKKRKQTKKKKTKRRN